MNKKIAVIAGDGIGPEVMAEAIKVLEKVAAKHNHSFTFNYALAGGAAYDAFGEHLPQETLKICSEADAILFGSVGGPVNSQNDPKWKGAEKAAILGLRKYFNLNINLRPATVFSSLVDICPLKPELIGNGFEIMIVRELAGGIYFGKHETLVENGIRVAKDEMRYDEEEIKSIAHVAFQIAEKRGKKLCSIDKANVLDCSVLWRNVVEEVAKNYPSVELTHQYVDSAAMQLVKNPRQYDVILTGNMFGDILSDLSSVFSGSLGLLASASLNKDGFGMYEPSGGSAPDIAGKNIANPIAQILSAAMMLKYSFALEKEYQEIYSAVEQALNAGARTGDIAGNQESILSTKQMGEAICKNI